MITAVGTAAAQTRPTTYAEFNTSVQAADAQALRAVITAGSATAIYLRRGIYEIWNPILIDRSTPLFIHGADRFDTRLVARDPTKPLFQIRRAPLVNFAGVTFQPTRSFTHMLNAKAIETVNTEPLTLELQDCTVHSSTLRLAGPGSYRVQNCSIAPGGKVRSGVMIEHPGADVLMFGGDITNGPSPLETDAYAHVWQKQGRLRIYAMTVEATLGEADFRIETASNHGPHVIANVRSEGANGALNQRQVSRLLHVPPTTQAVDVVVKASGGAWMTGPQSAQRSDTVNCKLVWYNAAGTLWLFGNRGENCIRHLVEGNAPQAQIVSLGNQLGSPQPFPVTRRSLITALDAFSNYFWTGLEADPWSRWVDGPAPRRLDPAVSVPLPPEDMLPPSLGRPTVTAAMPGMMDVKAAPYGARGDGTTDDTAAIQRALDANCYSSTPKVIFFPAGTYRISNTLYLNHHSGGTCHGGLPFGGWIAGAGSARTVIQMAPGIAKGTFATDGLALATVQGIMFKTAPWTGSGPKEPNVDLEFHNGTGYVATQQNSFYDVVFDGGYAGLAHGVRTGTGGQCSSTAVFRSKFQNSGIGMVSGHYNAIANTAYDVTFTGNDYAIGSWTMDENTMPPGGTFSAYRAMVRGTRKKDFLLRGSATGTVWYFYEWDSDANAYVTEIGPTATAIPVMLERARLVPRMPGSVAFDIASAQGPFFLRSTYMGAPLKVGGSNAGQGYAISVASDIARWAETEVRKTGAIERVSSPAAASLGRPGTPQVAH